MLLLLACSAPNGDHRKAELHEVLVRDNLVWVDRDPDLLADKFAVMAADPYDFMRGSLAWFVHDLQRPEPRLELSLYSPEESAMFILGDPHPENFSSMPAGWCGVGEPDEVLLEPNDLDSVGWGPWTLDVRRAALGLALLCDEDCDPALAFANGYVEGGSPMALGIISAPRQEAEDEGPRSKRLLAIMRGDKLARTDRHLDLLQAERQQVARLFEAWDGGDRLIDATRWIRKGVASRPATRYLWLVEHDTDDGAVRTLVNVREVGPAMAYPGAPRPNWPSNASRLEDGRGLWSRPDADGCADELLDGDQTFKVQSYSSYVQGFDHSDIDAIYADDLALELGKVLNRVHRRSWTADGDEVQRDKSHLIEELPPVTAQDKERLLADHQLFLELKDDFGPTLGMTP